MGKKKANGEGSITKRKDGRYMGRYTVESKRKAVYGDSFEEVRQKLNEILNEIAKGAYWFKKFENRIKGDMIYPR